MTGRSRWRISVFHPARSAFVMDSHAPGPLAAFGEVEHSFANRNPSLDPAGILRVDIRRVHEDDDLVEGVPT